MGPDLFKRWMDLLFWWLPRDGGSQGAATRPGERSDAANTSEEPRAGAKASTATPAETQTEAQAAKSTETPPEPQGQRPQPSPSSDAAVDDLTAIKGIGPAMAARLQDMGIRTFDDLAAADVKSVTQRLRDQSVVISEKKVEAWVTGARKQV